MRKNPLAFIAIFGILGLIELFITRPGYGVPNFFEANHIVIGSILIVAAFAVFIKYYHKGGE